MFIASERGRERESELQRRLWLPEAKEELQEISMSEIRNPAAEKKRILHVGEAHLRRELSMRV